jgi:hypothetical protein
MYFRPLDPHPAVSSRHPGNPIVSCAGAIALALMAFGAAHAEGLQPGLWRVITKTEVNGVVGPDQQTMRCLKPEDVSDLDATFSPQARTVNSTCERVEHESTAQRLKWRLQCTGQIDMDVAGEFVFDTPQHYTAVVTTQGAMAGRLMHSSRSLIEGQHTGDCQ